MKIALKYEGFIKHYHFSVFKYFQQLYNKTTFIERTSSGNHRASVKQFNISKTMEDKSNPKLAYLHQFVLAL